MKRRIYFSSPKMHGEVMKYIKKAFDTNWIAPLWKNVDEFEKELCKYGVITLDNENVGENIFENGLCIPSDVEITKEEQDRTIEIIKACF